MPPIVTDVAPVNSVPVIVISVGVKEGMGDGVTLVMTGTDGTTGEVIAKVTDAEGMQETHSQRCSHVLCFSQPHFLLLPLRPPATKTAPQIKTDGSVTRMV